MRFLKTLILSFRLGKVNDKRITFYNDLGKRPKLIYQKSNKADASPRICVVFHVHYIELLEQIILSLSSIRETYDLYITTTKEIDLSTSHLYHCREMKVFLVENKGRDILPFISILKHIPIDSYKYFLKIHTKLSPWIRDSDSNPMRMQSGDDWRDHLIQSLLGDEKRVSRIFQLFEDSPKIALVTAENTLIDIDKAEGSNKASIIRLVKRSKMTGVEQKFSFPAGSMYWATACLVQKISEVPVSYEDFEPETLQDDGTMAHAIERFIGLIICHNKMLSKEI
jgi:lipopolysaccharide biosynthesis protein